MISTLKKLQTKKVAQENNGGFTLIELLIVIVVLGILAAVVVFSLGGVTGSSAVAACQADGATLSTGIAAYAAQNGGSLPSSTAQLVNSGVVTTNALQSWPSNISHYTFALSTDGFLVLKASAGTAPTAPSSPTLANYIGTGTGGGWIQWTGATSCGTAGANVK